MGFFQNWQSAKMAKMQEQNICPDCRGRGFHYFPGSEYYFVEPLECNSCNGTGMYSEWDNNS